MRAFRSPLSLATFALALVLAGPSATAMPLFHKHQLQSHRVSALGDWRLKIVRNRFSGEIVCRLRSRNKKIHYSTGALGFRFPKHRDTQLATYRVDNEPIRHWRDDLPELIRLGTPIDGPGLDNPTDGTVWIPIARLQEANSVTIQSRSKRDPVNFHLRGFFGLLAIAQEQGCTPDSRFVR